MDVKLGWMGISVLLGALGLGCVATPESESDEQDTATVAQEAKSNSANPGLSDKVTICHVPPGNPANAHTIEVSVSALPAHLGHGDTLGACGGGGTGAGSAGTGGNEGGNTGSGGNTGTGGNEGGNTGTGGISNEGGNTGTGGSNEGGSTGGGGLAIGDYCVSSSQCGAGQCIDGACCDVNACVSVDSGAACSPASPCCGEAHCVGDANQTFCIFATDISCVLPGAECDPFNDACCWGLICGEDGTCQ